MRRPVPHHRAVIWALLGLLGGTVGCSLEQGKRGGICVRTTQCAAGLACVEGRCSRDLEAIADESTSPIFEMPDAAQDAASDARATPPDAARPDSDAAMSGDDAG
jgi:hypothetical protein